MAGKRFNSSGNSNRNYSSRGRKLKYSQELIEEQNQVEDDTDIMSSRPTQDVIYSSNKNNKSNKRTKKTITISFICLFLAIVFGVSGVCSIYFGNLLSLYNYSGSSQTNVNANGNNTDKISPVAAQETYADPEKRGDLYHDDAVLNILLMGVDDYQEDDIGRTDSMMLISIDRRHKELKMTSFMRDTYVQLSDGWAPNRLNVAYSLGGPECLVNTIEQNFHIDIDRYALIKYTAFVDIVNTLGGVDIELSNAESATMNCMTRDYSEPDVVPGMNTLTGSQARNYARIRALEGGDYERTERQRKIFTSLVNKFKGSDIFTISKLGNKVVSEITSDLTQEDVLSIITNALTYMNYKVLQNRIPSDEMHSNETVYISGVESAVLMPDVAWNTIYANEFIYRDDFPELAATLSYYGYKTADENNNNNAN